MIYLNSEILKKIMVKSLTIKKVDKDSIFHLVSSIIQTSLRGVDSHGINLFPHYFRISDTGRINIHPKMKINIKNNTVALVDGDHAYGHHAGAVGMEIAIELCKKRGVGLVNVSNSSHFGAASYFGLMAAKNNLIGFATTNANPLVKAYGSKETYFGTNPICFTAPLKNEEPLCLDMATSLTNRNKIKNYEREGKEIPNNWGYDEEGNPTTNPALVKTLAPIGEYKGFGLSLMVEVFCSILSGGVISKYILEMYDSLYKKRLISHFFSAIDPNLFIEIEMFKNNLQKMVEEIRNLPPLDGILKVMVPGDPEKDYYKERIVKGIPMDRLKFEEFLSISKDFKEAVIYETDS